MSRLFAPSQAASGLRAAVAVAGLLACIGAAAAQSPGPYDMRYAVKAETPLAASIERGAPAKQSLPAGADGIVLRWCRPEIPFATWQFGSPATWRKLLDERRCEVGWNGEVGFVEGAALEPVR